MIMEQNHRKTRTTVPAVGNGSEGELIRRAPSPDTALLLSSIHSTGVPKLRSTETPSAEPGDVVTIHYCFHGRAEAKLPSGESIYISNNEMVIDAGFYSAAPEELLFPGSDYHGLTARIRVRDTPGWELRLDGRPVAAPESLRDKAREYGKLCLSQTDEKTRLCFDSLRCDILRDAPRECLLLDLAQLLLHLDETFPGRQPRRKYFSKSQMQIAQAVRDIVTGDLATRHSAAALAKQFGVSETCLKNYFRGVYGCGYSEFQNEARMKRAAELLAGERRSIGSIGASVGFSNQSAFARVFRDYHGVTPIEYRRQLHLAGQDGES